MKDIGGRTMTLENLKRIKEAMDRIEAIDRSTYFNQFMMEIEWRLEYMEREAKS